MIDALKTLPTYRKWKPRGVGMLLEAVALQLTTDKQERLLIAGSLSVEHVLPQKWQLWPAPVAPEGVTDPVGWRNALLHTVGNLTLTTQKLNSSVSNGVYDTKRAAIEKHSALSLNRLLLKEKTWDEGVIQRRSEELARIIVSIWRGPDVAAVTPEPFTHALEPMVNVDDTFEALRAALHAAPPTGFKPKSSASGGMQLHSDDWGSASLRYVFHAAENDNGEDQIIFSLEDAFGSDTPQKPFMVPMMARLAQPVQLAFGDHRVGFRPNVIDVVLPGDEPVQRVQQAQQKLIQITVPAIEAAFTAYRASLTSPGAQRMAHLDVLADTLRPALPPHFYFMAADTYGGRNYRRIASVA
ncbi:HNH endonuclease family protein [Deinococcus sp. SM5_A1]|uniref:HNH endonuclease family protein n=1 Tax=Deinococcus sp. SM5_A1 TaxID=3379094 RepID=UPI00385EC351